MQSKLFTVTLVGLEPKVVEVEVDHKRGNHVFSIVGLAGKSIQEAKDRVPPAIRNSGAIFDPVKIVVNLAPAELNKGGPSFDFPIAVCYLLSTGQIDLDPEKKIFIGELALGGSLRPVNGILPIAASMQKLGFTDIYLPEDNAKEASVIPGINIYPVKDLYELMNHFNGGQIINPIDHTSISIDDSNLVEFDFKDIKGQTQAKRALEIAAAGGHNVLLSGVPGSGKTLLSRSFKGILPRPTIDECLDISKIYSVYGGNTRKDLVMERPFRSPHHTSSDVAMVGGGQNPKPGEISLSHRGVLFLDEFPEFSSKTLEALRQPLEDKIVTISRASLSITFPANFILVAAMNPCKCGFKGDPEKECSCSPNEINKYRKKISGPILDRIDLLINVAKVKNDSLLNTVEAESSLIIRERVQRARDIQTDRFKNLNIVCNADMNQKQMKEFINLDSESINLLTNALNRFNLSARSYYRVLKVARTIADLECSQNVVSKHIAEALGFRVEI